MLYAAISLLGIALPVIAAFIIIKLGFNWLFIFVLLFCSSELYLNNSIKFLSDIPSTLLLFCGLYFLIKHFIEEKNKDKFIILSILFFVLSFYFRYGVISILLVIAIITLFFKYKLIYENFSKYLSYLSAFIFLLIPHFIYSYLNTGNIFGIIIMAGELSQRKFIGEGLLSYIYWMPQKTAGFFIGSFIIITILLLLIDILRQKEKSFIVTYVLLISLGSIFITGLFTHAEERYIIFPIVLLLMLSVYYLNKKISSLNKKNYFATLLIVFTLINLIFNFNYQIKRFNFLNQKRTVIKESSNWIKDQVSNSNCFIFSKTIPQTTWYSGCKAFHFNEEIEEEFIKNKYNIFYSKQDRNLLKFYRDNYKKRNIKEVYVISDSKGIFGDALIYFNF